MYIAFIYISKNLHLSAEDLFNEGTLPSFQQTLDLSNATIAWTKISLCKRVDVSSKAKCCIIRLKNIVLTDAVLPPLKENYTVRYGR